MARVRVQIDRFDRISGDEIDHVEGLRQPHEVAVILEVARAPATLEVGTVRRAGHSGEIYRVAADFAVAHRVSRMHGKTGRHGFDPAHDHFTIHEYPLQIPVDPRSVLFVDPERLLVQHFEADFLENAHRTVVYQVQRFGADSGNRFIGIE